jgi:hypothetical protein
MTDSVDETDDSASRSDEQHSADGETEWTLETQIAFETEDANSLVVTVVYAVAEAEDKPPVEITEPPLQDVVDIEALSQSFSGTSSGTGDGALSVEFTYRGYRVVVRDDAWVQVYSQEK